MPCIRMLLGLAMDDTIHFLKTLPQKRLKIDFDSASVFDAFDLEDMNIESIEDILVRTPNLSYFAAGAEGLGTATISGG
jgi:hypothetical protein